MWYYDYRTNIHHTLKQSPLRYDDRKKFIELYNPENLHNRHETWNEVNPDGRWRKYTYKELTNRDKTSMDIFWIKDDSLTDLDNLPYPDILAADIVENIEAGPDNFLEIVNGLDG